MMALIKDVIEYLQRNGHVDGSTGWKAYANFLPESPDQCIVITQTPGGFPESRFNLDYPSFQVRGRSAKYGYEALESKMQDIYRSLHNADLDDPNVSPSGTYVMCQAVQSGPLSLGEDENRRSELTWNFNVISHR